MTQPLDPLDDPHLWLEDVGGEQSLAWAREHNARATQELEAVPGFAATRQRIKAILDSRENIPWVAKRAQHLYNFWQDDEHPRGQWRRTTLDEYRKRSPAWDVLLDVDALGKAEGESWVWKGARVLYPDYARALLLLSRGGADAFVVREFDIPTKAFVAGGFALPEAKHDVAWKDIDTLYVGTDFGPGSFTDSGYARIAKEWRRGTALSEARTLFEGKQTDVAASAGRQHDHGRVRDFVWCSPSFFSNDMYLLEGDAPAQLRKVEKPDDATVSFWDDQALVSLRSDWTIADKTWPAGSLLITGEQEYLAGKRDFTSLFTPTPNSSLADYTAMKTVILVNELVDVHNVLARWSRVDGAWTRELVPTPPLATFGASAWDDEENDDYFMTESSFLAPTTLALVRGGAKEPLKSTPAFFNAAGLEVTQHFVTSKDGTRVPYFQVARQGMSLEGNTPTLIEGYGGFEVSLTPGYDASAGVAWLERGGVYVVPNIRGGGEYGPTWHQAAVKAHRQRAYEDFAAIAEDLIARKVTRPERLGIKGGSNGGLLVGVMMTQRPEMFGAVVCQAPLLDMKRYSQLLAGASWMGEYGDPSIAEEWEFIARYSPYHNVQRGQRYPRVLFTGSTRDDRVHPAHARKMMARMVEQGHDVLFYENIEGGHGGAADHGQRAYLSTLAWAFLWAQLGVK